MVPILHIINSLAVGGAEMLLKDTLNAFEAKGYPYRHIVVPLFDSGPITADFGKNIAVMPPASSHGGWVQRIRFLRRLVDKHSISLIHAHLYESCIASRLVSGGTIPVVNSYHTGFHNPKSIEFGLKRLFVDRLLQRWCNHFIFVSEAVARQTFPSLPVQRKSSILYNFASHDFFQAYIFRPQLPLRLVAVGNLREQKNYQLLLEAIAAVQCPQLECDIYGDGDLRPSLQSFIDKHKIKVRLMGRAKIKPSLLSQYDAFVMTSKHEGMPISLIEAIVTGMPAVLNDISELRETAGEAGLYFERDQPKGLEKILKSLLQTKSTLCKLADNTQQIAARYKAEDHLKALDMIYQGLLAKKIYQQNN